MNAARAALTLAAAVALGGCPRPVAAPVLDGAWPATPARYAAVTETWTRHGEVQETYQLVASVHATLLSPPWRAALAARRATVGKLGAEGRAEVDTAQRAADAAAWEFEVVMSTWDRKENDLDRGARSTWRVVLVDADGHEVPPIEIVRDKRPDEVIHSDFPAFGDFAKAYVVRFPKTAHVLGPGVSRVGLRLSSTRGGIDLVWASGPRVDASGSRP